MSATELVDCGKGTLSVASTCRLLEVAPSSYYERRSRKPSQRSLDDAALSIHVRETHLRSRCRYGSERVMRALRKRGVRVGKNRVARLMREQSLIARRKRRFRVTTASDHSLPIAPNLLEQKFTASAPDRIWVGDMTYVWTREGWMYLAVLVDVFSRRVVGWAMRPYLTRDLPMEALRRAVELRRPAPGLIHHTDRGSQYASKDYHALMKTWKMRPSMSRSGNCFDNAMAESFFATLEFELLQGRVFESRSEAVWAVAKYIENFYNRERLHSALGYQSPLDFEVEEAVAIAA